MKAEVPVQKRTSAAADVRKELVLVLSNRGKIKQTCIQPKHLPDGTFGFCLWLSGATHGPKPPDAKLGCISKVYVDACVSLVSRRLLFRVCSLL